VSGNGNSVVMTDNGAVKQAIELAGTSTANIVDALKAMATANQASFDKTLALVGDNTEKTNAAFAKANEEVNGNRTLVIVGMVAVGMIAMQQGIFK
jgi:Zn-dependent alcohol dehydrogenase